MRHAALVVAPAEAYFSFPLFWLYFEIRVPQRPLGSKTEASFSTYHPLQNLEKKWAKCLSKLFVPDIRLNFCHTLDGKPLCALVIQSINTPLMPLCQSLMVTGNLRRGQLAKKRHQHCL